MESQTGRMNWMTGSLNWISLPLVMTTSRSVYVCQDPESVGEPSHWEVKAVLGSCVLVCFRSLML